MRREKQDIHRDASTNYDEIRMDQPQSRKIAPTAWLDHKAFEVSTARACRTKLQRPRVVSGRSACLSEGGFPRFQQH
jgi:hypothetical protein